MTSTKHGGFFYNLDNFEHDYADVVRVTPCSDAGAADNCYWVERLVVNVPHNPSEKLQSVLAAYGYENDLDTLTPAQQKHLLVEACVGYGYYDLDHSEVVSLGDYFCGEKVKVDRKLHGNTSLRRYARRIAKDNW